MVKASDTIVVNLYGSPGAGKSTTRAGVFRELKLAGVNCEEVYEFAKDLTWEKRHVALSCQPYVFGKQFHHIWRLIGQVEVIVTDSPLLLQSFYGMVNQPDFYPASFHQSVLDFSGMFTSVNYLIKRVKPYNAAGRHQSEAEADLMHGGIESLLINNDVAYAEIDGDEKAAKHIADVIGTMVRAIQSGELTKLATNVPQS